MIPRLFLSQRGKSRPPIAEMIASTAFRPRRLLFVEDDDVFKRYLADVVASKFDCEIVTVSSVREATAMLEGFRFDAALLDVRVTNGDGVSLYRLIVSRWPSTEVVFLTGFDTPETRFRIEEVGPARVFSKDRLTDSDFLARLLGLLGIRQRSSAG